MLVVGARGAARSRGRRLRRAGSTHSPPTHLISGRMPQADDAAGYFHTGGTTGTPKLVRHTHANQVSQAWALRLMRPGRARQGHPVRPAAVPRGRRADARPGAAGQRRPRGGAQRGRLARPARRAQRVGAGAALPAASCSAPCPRCSAAALQVPVGGARRQQPEACLGRRLGDPGGGDPGLRAADAPAGARGLRHDRDLQRAHDGLPRHAAPTRLGGPAAALLRARAWSSSTPTAACSATARPTRSAWWRWPAPACSAAT